MSNWCDMDKCDMQARIEELERKLYVKEAHDLGALSEAHTKVGTCGEHKYKGSGVILSMQNLSGTTICRPFIICDGLSEKAIAAILEDIERTYTYRTSLFTTFNKLRSK